MDGEAMSGVASGSGSGSGHVPEPAPPPSAPAANAVGEAEPRGQAATEGQADANASAIHQSAASAHAGLSSEATATITSGANESNQVPEMTRRPFCEICEIYFESSSIRRAHMRYHQLTMKAKFGDGELRTITRKDEEDEFRCPIEGCTFSSIHTPMMNSHAHRCKPGEPRKKAEKCAPRKREFGLPSQHKADFMKTRAKEQADAITAKLKAEAVEKLEAKQIARAKRKSEASRSAEDSAVSVAAAAAAAVAAATDIFQKPTAGDLADDTVGADETAALLNLAEFDFHMASTNDKNAFAPSGETGAHPCPKCGQVFASDSQRRYHRRVFHQNIIKDLFFPEREKTRLTNIERNEEDGVFHCPFSDCLFQSPNPDHLSKHAMSCKESGRWTRTKPVKRPATAPPAEERLSQEPRIDEEGQGEVRNEEQDLLAASDVLLRAAEAAAVAE